MYVNVQRDIDAENLEIQKKESAALANDECVLCDAKPGDAAPRGRSDV